MKKITIPFRRYHILKRLLLAFVVVLVALQLTVDYLVYRNIYQPSDASIISQLIIAGVDNAKKPVPIEASTGKQYIAPLRIVFPADTKLQLGQLDYSYEPANNGSAALLQITQHRLVRAVEARMLTMNQKATIWESYDPAPLFDQIPSLQACSRGVSVVFDDLAVKQYTRELQLRGTRQLADGRTLQIYTDNPILCANTDFSQLIDYLKTAESYSI